MIWALLFVVFCSSKVNKKTTPNAPRYSCAVLYSLQKILDENQWRQKQVSLMVIALWFLAWTPYLIINYSGIFELLPLSPLGTVCGAVFSKANAVYNPIVYAISRPKNRAALDEKFPCLKKSQSQGDAVSVKTSNTES